MKIAFDAEKDRINILERGLSLSSGQTIIENVVTVLRDARFDYGEDRFIAFGLLGDRLHVCVFTVRDDITRIISVRKANDREVKRYGRR